MREKRAKKGQEQKKLREVITPKKKLSKSMILLFGAIFAFALYSAIIIVGQNTAIKEKRAELAALEEELQIIEIENDYLEQVKNYKGKDLDEYIENIAREDLDYIKNGERVFVNVSGN